ncbi:sulfurtransferase TusE [Candidatus Pantoea edessiphila]|uniref:Sulfurtransferase n=1 Tax=Candidatus Pantoea edessiphila TaxID=2044610 RepID=A0A2P5T0I4_9GAMM|nr:TusE/DsrC/DsvC family sulfur relay protein [Candidatus Pantoea edessiphila]PPI88097.1 sulfurtransferase TusE [Candidatus Pantoea edessiphila]
MSLDKINIIYDHEGYLKKIDEWNENIAINLAKKENIFMTEQHWNIVYLLRSFYLKYNISPTMRMLSKIISDKYGKEKASSLYLFKLFPKGILNQATKISGIPKPNKCL